MRGHDDIPEVEGKAVMVATSKLHAAVKEKGCTTQAASDDRQAYVADCIVCLCLQVKPVLLICSCQACPLMCKALNSDDTYSTHVIESCAPDMVFSLD